MARINYTVAPSSLSNKAQEPCRVGAAMPLTVLICQSVQRRCRERAKQMKSEEIRKKNIVMVNEQKESKANA